MAEQLSTAEKGALVAEFFEAGVAMMERKLREQHGASNEAAVRRDLEKWLRRADDAIPGDVAGPVHVRYRAP